LQRAIIAREGPGSLLASAPGNDRKGKLSPALQVRRERVHENGGQRGRKSSRPWLSLKKTHYVLSAMEHVENPHRVGLHAVKNQVLRKSADRQHPNRLELGIPRAVNDTNVRLLCDLLKCLLNCLQDAICCFWIVAERFSVKQT